MKVDPLRCNGSICQGRGAAILRLGITQPRPQSKATYELEAAYVV